MDKKMEGQQGRVVGDEVMMQIDFSKYTDGLVPAVVQHWQDGRVLMVGFMNEEAIVATRQSGHVTFFSRSKQRLWVKGETSGHYLELKEIIADCDRDTLLVKANPFGPTCHTGADTCFGEKKPDAANDAESKVSIEKLSFLAHLESVIAGRKANPDEKSYTSSLFAKGINKVAQKVGEEAVELVIEAKDENDDLFLGEAADLLFHYMILLQAKGFTLGNVIDILEKRHK
jgi:phosphoribosyl-AMP cyclohydrolase / phosphoribosyl-ATP pyrophosphohydrolase